MTQGQLKTFIERLDLCHDLLSDLAVEISPLSNHMNKAAWENAYSVCNIARLAVYAAKRQYDTDDFRLAIETYQAAKPKKKAQIMRIL